MFASAIDKGRHVTVANVVDACPQQRKLLLVEFDHGWRKVEFAHEPGPDIVGVAGSNLHQGAVVDQRTHMGIDGLLNDETPAITAVHESKHNRPTQGDG